MTEPTPEEREARRRDLLRIELPDDARPRHRRRSGLREGDEPPATADLDAPRARDESAADVPVVDVPVAVEPAADLPAADALAADLPAADLPAADALATDAPATDALATDALAPGQPAPVAEDAADGAAAQRPSPPVVELAEVDEVPAALFDQDVTGRRAGWSRARPAAAALALVALFATGLGLVYAGASVVRESTAGDVFAPVEDPDEPGFEAFVDTTPTMLVIHTRDGLVDGATVITVPSAEGGGAVLFVPVRTIADLGVLEENPIEYSFDLGDAEYFRASVQGLLTVALDEVTVVDSERWADLVAPVAPIEVDNPDVIRDADGDIAFESGMIDLDADDVGPYLELVDEDESDLARLFRHREFWSAWLDAVEAAGAVDAVPGEVQSGIGRFIRVLARGPRVFQTLPVTETERPLDAEGTAFEVDPDRLAAVIEELVPFPRSPSPGVRARLRILNGTPDTDQALQLAQLLPPLGTEIELVGNAASLDVDRTTVSYFGAEFADEARAIVDLLGVGEVVEERRPSDVVDITVTLGLDSTGIEP